MKKEVEEKKENIVEKEIKVVEKEIAKIDFKKFFNNYWAVAAVVLAILLIGVLIFNRGSGSGSGICAVVAADKVIAFVQAQGGEATLVSKGDKYGMYEIVLSINGQERPVYVSKDGKNLFLNLIPLDAAAQAAAGSGTQETPKEVPKSDKPVVEAFVFSYCPFGLQFEKALAPVYTLLKNKADISLVQIGAMHGEYEHQEALRQICIQKLYGKDKLWSYLNKFMIDTAIGACSGQTTCSDPLVEKIMVNLSIDKAKVNACMPTDGETLYNVDGARAQALGIGGSPTFVINGVQVNVGRTPDAIGKAICAAFTTAPAECSQTLSTTALTAGFGASAGASTGASC